MTTGTLSGPDVLTLRMRSQRLSGRRPSSVHDAVRGVGALQAQDTSAARLAVRCRTEGLDARAVTRACNDERSVVRTWAMRGTLHMVAAEDAGWLVGLLGPIFAAAGRRRRLQLGLDDETCARALAALRDSLASRGPLSRAEVVREVRVRGVPVDAEGQAPAHLVAYAAMRGLICRGPDRERDEPTYVLLDDWVGGRLGREPDASLAELARRYLSGHGPAGPGDFASWAGVGAALARRGFQLIAGELREVQVAGETAWMPADGRGPAHLTAPRPCVRLLGAFDAYLLGYRRRDLALAPAFQRRIQAGGGWIHPAVVVDGRVVGTWRLQRRGQELAVRVESFERLSAGTHSGLEAEAADVGRFLRVPATLTVGAEAERDPVRRL